MDQPIFCFDTPTGLRALNGRVEFNVHNLYAPEVDGGTYRY